MDIEHLPPLNELTSEQKDEVIIELLAIIKDLRQEVAELKNKLNMNSQNSHKPPSTDGFKKVKIQREKSSKKSGGQIGHKGNTLDLSDKPNQIIEHSPRVCTYCQTELEKVQEIGHKKAQVFEIPELKIQITEHRAVEKICPCCGKFNLGKLPEEIKFRVQYGPRLCSFLIYLHHYHYVSSDRITEFFMDIFGHQISEGIIFKSEEEAYFKLSNFENELKTNLEKKSLLHADETSLRVNGNTNWLHVLSTDTLTYYFVHPKRGKKATDEMGILPFFKGTLMHDNWKAYFQYDCEHALCNAHHLRELKAISEGTGHIWAQQMADLLKEINQIKEAGHLKDISSFEERYDCILSLGYKEAANFYEKERTKKKSRPKEICLLDRLKHRKKSALSFMYNEEIPFTNNLAERDIRMMKIKMKVSGCFRNIIGAQIFCRIRGFISTLKKQKIAIFQALSDLLCGSFSFAFSSINPIKN